MASMVTHGGHTCIHPRIDPKPIKMAWSRLANVLRQLIFLTLLCTLGIVFAGVTFWSESIAIAQMHNMTMSSSSPNSSTPIKKTSFSAIGQIGSLIITVPRNDFNIAHAFNVILTGDWNLSVMKGKITNFVANFLASPMDGTKPHMHQISNFKTTNKKIVELLNNGSSLMNGTADIKINGQVVWKGAHISITIINGSTFIIDPIDGDTDNHFGEQSVYGIVTRLIT